MERKDFIYLFLIFILMTTVINKCGEPSLQQTTTKSYNVKDTTVVTRIDTIPFILPIARNINIPVYSPVYDTIRNSYIYNNPVDDSLITGNISTTFMDCKMLSQKLTYSPKFPKYIIRTDSVTIHDSTYVEKTIYPELKTQIGLGFTGVINSQPTVYLNFLVKTKKNDIFAIGYDPFYKSYLVQYNKILTFKRK